MSAGAFPYDFFADLPRQGPGSDADTQRAFACVQAHIPPQPRVLDCGCGTGAQTLTLAHLPQMAGGEIVAVDSTQLFITALERAAALNPPHCTVIPHVGDMGQPERISGAAPGSFDLIWSEAAAYSIRFANALRVWRPLLRQTSDAYCGCLVVSELTWFTKTPQKDAPEAWKFWSEYYPDMRPVKHNIPLFTAAGYAVKAHFPLPENAWYAGYYGPLEQALRNGGQLDDELHVMLRREMELFRKYSRWYGYTFYCAQAV